MHAKNGPQNGESSVECFQQLAVAWHKGRPQGVYSVCSALPWVLEAAIDQANEDGSDILIEATSNQVPHGTWEPRLMPGGPPSLLSGAALTRDNRDYRFIPYSPL
jgi:hypothetical protein